MSFDISVVVPVYNASPYLEDCIGSLQKQTKSNIELIFVDDGSTDNSADIIESYQAHDSRIKLIRQNNQYAGVARNNGMKIATGKYIIFLDADDFFAPDMLQKSFNVAERNQADIVYFDYCFFDNRSKTTYAHPPVRLPRIFKNISDLGSDAYALFNAFPWNKLFRRSFISENNLKFKPVRKCNDTYFTLVAGAVASKIVYMNDKFVFYRVNNDASLQGKSTGGLHFFVDCAVDVKSGLIERNVYNGNIRNSCINNAKRLILHIFSYISDVDILRQHFEYTKAHLVPELFDNEDEFHDDSLILDIHSSSDFDDFLFRQYCSLRKEIQRMVPISSIDYHVGNRLLSIPRKIKHSMHI